MVVDGPREMELRAEEMEVVGVIALTVMKIIVAESRRVAQMPQRATELREEINLRGDGLGLRTDITRISIVNIFLLIVGSYREGKGLETVGIDGFRPQRPRVTIYRIGIGRALVVGAVGGSIDIGGGSIGHERLMAAKMAVEIEIEHG